MLLFLFFFFLRIALTFCSNECSDDGNSTQWLFGNNPANGYCLSKVKSEKQSISFEEFVAACANHGAMAPIFRPMVLNGTSTLTSIRKKKEEEEEDFNRIVQILLNASVVPGIENASTWVAYRAFSNRCQYDKRATGNQSLQIHPGSKLFFQQGRIQAGRDGQTASYYICQKKTDLCSQIACQNNGKCRQIGNCYECQCLEGFQGLGCEFKVENSIDQFVDIRKSFLNASLDGNILQILNNNSAKTTGGKLFSNRELFREKSIPNAADQEKNYSKFEKTAKNVTVDRYVIQNASLVELGEYGISNETLVSMNSTSLQKNEKSRRQSVELKKSRESRDKHVMSKNITEDPFGDMKFPQGLQENALIIENGQQNFSALLGAMNNVTTPNQGRKEDWMNTSFTLANLTEQKLVVEPKPVDSLRKPEFISNAQEKPAVVRNYASRQSRLQLSEARMNFSTEDHSQFHHKNMTNFNQLPPAKDGLNSTERSFWPSGVPRETKNLIDSLLEKGLEESRNLTSIRISKNNESLNRRSNHSEEIEKILERSDETRMLETPTLNHSTPNSFRNKGLESDRRHIVTFKAQETGAPDYFVTHEMQEESILSPITGQQNFILQTTTDIFNQSVTSLSTSGRDIIDFVTKSTPENHDAVKALHTTLQHIIRIQHNQKTTKDVGLEMESTMESENYDDDQASAVIGTTMNSDPTESHSEEEKPTIDSDDEKETTEKDNPEADEEDYDNTPKAATAVNATQASEQVQTNDEHAVSKAALHGPEYNSKIRNSNNGRTTVGKDPSVLKSTTESQDEVEGSNADEKDNDSKTSVAQVSSSERERNHSPPKRASKSTIVYSQSSTEIPVAAHQKMKPTIETGADGDNKREKTSLGIRTRKVIPTIRPDRRSPHHKGKTPSATKAMSGVAMKVSKVASSQTEVLLAPSTKTAAITTTLQVNGAVSPTSDMPMMESGSEISTSTIKIQESQNNTKSNNRSSFREMNVKKMMYFTIGVAIFVAFCCFLCLCAFFRYKGDRETKKPFT